jgi:predicted metal-binding membrane protein
VRLSRQSRSTPISQRNDGQSTALLERSQLSILIILAVLTIAAWGLTIRQAGTMDMPMGIGMSEIVPGDASGDVGDMSDMDATSSMEEMASPVMTDMPVPGWSLAGLAAFVVIWAVMMVAMMLPAVAPMLLLYRTIADKKRSGNEGFSSTWLLLAGYLLLWTAVGLIVYALVRLGANVAGRLGVAERQAWAPLALGAVLIIAGLYQFTPLKRACLRQCQSPFGFVMGHWQDGRFGAFRMGVVHGAYCFGCCWALFAVLVATGIMSIAWMLLLTLVVFAEKVLPHGQRTAIAVGLAFIALGVLVAAGVTSLPGIS